MLNTTEKTKPTPRHVRLKFNNKDIGKMSNLFERESHGEKQINIKLPNSHNGPRRYFFSIKVRKL